jgi:hypothetical protein
MESFYVQILYFYGLELFPKLLFGILFSLLQASICTEWEQNSMVLTPGTNIGARVTANPLHGSDNLPVATLPAAAEVKLPV